MGLKIVVTGGAGFIGSHICEALLLAGHTVYVIDNFSSGRRENLSEQVQVKELDIRSPKARAFLRELAPDVIVHTAAQISVRASMEDPVFDTEVNVVGMVNILQAFLGKPQPFIVFLSTGGAIYGEQEVFPATEDHPIRPASIYGHAKRVGESYLEFWNREMKLPFCALRLANVYGPRQNPHGEAGVIAIFLNKLLAGKVPTINGNGEQTRDFVFVKDVARAVQMVVEKRIQGIYNIGTGREASVNQLFQMLRESLQSELTATHGPAKDGEQMRSSISAALAQKEIGWKPQVPLTDGIRETAQWFMRESGAVGS